MKITNLIPHRDPFLFVDSIQTANTEKIIGTRMFRPDENFFAGHFPNYPVVPGVILIESMAQCGGAGVSKLGILHNKLFFLASVSKVKFRQPVRPNDTIRMEIDNQRISPHMIRQRGKAYVNETCVCEAEWMCIVGEQ